MLQYTKTMSLSINYMCKSHCKGRCVLHGDLSRLGLFPFAYEIRDLVQDGRQIKFMDVSTLLLNVGAHKYLASSSK